MITITIPNQTPPSWNKLYSGKHWAVRKKMADEWHELVHYACLEQKIKKVTYNGRTLHIHTTVYFPNRRVQTDADNICDKIIIDGLKEAVIGDDDAKHIRLVTTETRVDRENPRTEINISWV